MADDKRSGGFWSSLPGVLTGLAALVSALAATYAVVRGPGADRGAAASTRTAAPEAIAAATETSPGCAPGMVWREARPNDRVCVTRQRRQAVGEENQVALDTREPAGGAHGQNTCRQGFVWREAMPGDLTCVTPDSRKVTLDENAFRSERAAPGQTS